MTKVKYSSLILIYSGNDRGPGDQNDAQGKWVFFILVSPQLSVCLRRQVDKLLDKVTTQNED